MPDQAEIHRMAQDKDSSVRERAAKSLGAAFSEVPDKTIAWKDLHRLIGDEVSSVRSAAAVALGTAFGQVPDKDQAWQDLVRLTQDEDCSVKWRSVKFLRLVFRHLPDKDQAWKDIIRLTHDKDHYVRLGAAEALVLAVSHIQDRSQAWKDLYTLAFDNNIDVRACATAALGRTFSQVPEKDQAWQDLHRLTLDENIDVRGCAAIAIGLAFSHVPDKDQAWQDLHRLSMDKDIHGTMETAPSIGIALGQIPKENQEWINLVMAGLGSRVAEAIGLAIAHISGKDQAWKDLIRLSQDRDSHVRMYAYHSLGRATISKATEAKDNDTLKNQLMAAVTYFEKSSQESEYGPATFCHSFYRTYYTITFQQAKEDEVQRYLAEAKEAVGGSESKEELFKAVENLAQALQESQKLKGRSLEEIASELNTYRWYCDKAASHMATAEKSAPGAVKLMRKCNPMLEERIQFTIREIQDLARQICQVTAGRGPGAESFCDQIKDSARSLSTADFNKILKIISEFGSILLDKTVLLPEGERDLVESLLDDIANIGPVPEKLDKLKKVVKFYLSRMKDDKFLQEMSEKLDEIYEEIKALRESLLNRFDSSERKILSAIFERLDKDRLEIVKEILDAAEKDKIPKELIEETLEATEDLISEIKSMQAEIRDPAIASWDEALNSPELEIENRLKVSIPIIPLLLTYEGSYNFKSGLKLDETWNKLRTLIVNACRSC